MSFPTTLRTTDLCISPQEGLLKQWSVHGLAASSRRPPISQNESCGQAVYRRSRDSAPLHSGFLNPWHSLVCVWLHSVMFKKKKTFSFHATKLLQHMKSSGKRLWRNKKRRRGCLRLVCSDANQNVLWCVLWEEELVTVYIFGLVCCTIRTVESWKKCPFFKSDIKGDMFEDWPKCEYPSDTVTDKKRKESEKTQGETDNSGRLAAVICLLEEIICILKYVTVVEETWLDFGLCTFQLWR